ncbi:MAG: hypothetical protein GXP28_04210 [Planctomycetes bacterium]|nr:hypothetical protein [Planctomycetota bacterium]
MLRLFTTAQSTSYAVMMRKCSQLNVALAVAVITAASGCMSPWTLGQSAANSVSVVQNTSLVSQAENLETADPAESLEPGLSDAPQTTEEAMAAVMDELQQIGAVDHAAQQKLMANLHAAKPEHWPRMVQQFQSALAFREQLAAKESQSPEGETPDSSVSSDSVYALKENNAPKDGAPKGMPSIATSSEQTAMGPTSPMPPPRNTPIDHKPVAPAVADFSADERQVVEQTGHVAPLAPLGASEKHLQAAIVSMEQATQEPPSSVEDVQQHMRLRLLRLLAGQESAAVSPIPGASSTQQDYWSKQLFALSTYLDNEQQPDVKRRAAGSLIHLDSARASLAELATLHVRNLTFVDSVDGFGVYQEREETKFRPGEQVTLYTEVENFRSQSTKEGFHTQLSTSYEVLDKNGTRVDGAQFPDVEDRCKKQRRDFHMQYGVALPTQIYAGHYQLQLTITDQLSHKIGQTSVPFEIVE